MMGNPRSSAVRFAVDDLADTAYETLVGILGVIMGFVAIGVQRKQSWTRTFTKPLLRKEIRVKGYLRPVYRGDCIGARSCVPIENPGLPTVEVGEGTELAGDLSGLLVEFVGTPDGTPPTLRVMKGRACVNGEPVEESRRLEDGDVLELGSREYTYLRGSRR